MLKDNRFAAAEVPPLYRGDVISNLQLMVERHEKPRKQFSPIERIAIYLHNHFTDHDDPESGLGQECPKCMEAALELMNIAVLSLGGEG